VQVPAQIRASEGMMKRVGTMINVCKSAWPRFFVLSG
jgi:hypothetical protein